VKLKKTIGILMILTPFVAVFIVACFAIGIIKTIFTFVMAAIVVFVVDVGLRLYYGS
jgi:hypothetical protein